MDWNRERDAIKHKEVYVIIVMGVIFLLGIIFDIIVRSGNIIVEVPEYYTTYLTLLQIQATTTTLNIAIISLLTGKISDAFMGVPVTLYFLNKRP